MRIRMAVIVAAILFTGYAAGGQTALAQIPDSVKGEMPGGGLEVLSDTEGIDFKPYLRQWQETTESSWKAAQARGARAVALASGTAVIRFKILPGGQLMAGGMVLEERSGNTALDRAAWDAIAGAS